MIEGSGKGGRWKRDSGEKRGRYRGKGERRAKEGGREGVTERTYNKWVRGKRLRHLRRLMYPATSLTKADFVLNITDIGQCHPLVR